MAVTIPDVPTGNVVLIPGRGEVFYREHRLPTSPGAPNEPTVPCVVLLHGWTASADVQFVNAYEAVGERYEFIAPDHRGHGRGPRTPFTLEDAADDVAALLRQKQSGPVIAVGYSMGGPIAMLLARRHPDLVVGIVMQATAMEWSGSWYERLGWRLVGVMGSTMRSRWYSRLVGVGLNRMSRENPRLAEWRPWLDGELRRNDPSGVVEAGKALAHYDARPWAKGLRIPAAMLITTRDRVVLPRKQRALAAALGATVRELDGDHFCSLVQPVEYAAATRWLLDEVAAKVAATSRPPAR